jgi:hypothetical protein
MSGYVRSASLATIMLIAGCVATLPQLHTRAALDLACAPENLRDEAIDAATRVVTGCGKRAVYVEMFNDSRYPTWLLNSDIRTVDSPAARASNP